MKEYIGKGFNTIETSNINYEMIDGHDGGEQNKQRRTVQD